MSTNSSLKTVRQKIPATPVESAAQAGLVYVSPDLPGITRKKSGKGYSYYRPNGDLVTDPEERARCDALAIPPAYEEVWICPLRNGHLQATGYDAKGRKQYRYHEAWTEYQNYANHLRMIEFGYLLPQIRTRVQADLQTSTPALHKQKVLATVVRLLDLTLIRIGNNRYARKNNSYGLSTIRKRHVELEDKESFAFEFQGKSGQDHRVEVHNAKLARIVRRSMEIPGYELFKYFDSNGTRHDLTSTDVNDYLHRITQTEISAKDFRTWWASVLAFMTLEENLAEITTSDDKILKKQITKAVKYASSRLGNTPSVCKKYYVYPGLLDAYLQKTMSSIIQNFSETYGPKELSLEERKTLYFLEHHLLENKD